MARSSLLRLQIGTVGDHRRSSDWRGSSNGPNPLCHEFVEDHEFNQNTLLSIKENAPYFSPTSIKIVPAKLSDRQYAERITSVLARLGQQSLRLSSFLVVDWHIDDPTRPSACRQRC